MTLSPRPSSDAPDPPAPQRVALAGFNGEMAPALGDVDCETLHVADADALRSLLRSDPPDLVLLDADVLGVDAGEMTGAIKAAAPQTMVMAISSSASPDSPIAALRAGAYDYFRKPLEPEVLSRRVCRALENKRLGDAIRRRDLQLEGAVAERAEELLEMKTYLDNLLETAGDAILTVGRDGQINSWNSSAADILGYTKEEMIGADALVLASGEGARDQMANALRLAREGQRATTIETLWLRKDRKEAIVSVTVSPIRSAGDAVAGILTIARDMTERTKLQEELFHSGKLASIGQLAAGVAHQINNPLGAISGRAQMLLRGGPDVDAKFLNTQLEKIHADCTRITETVNDLLGFARKTETVKQYTDVNAILDETLEMVEHEIIAHKAHIERDYSASLPPVVASDNHLRQLFANLVTNACDAMPAGGTLRISTHFRPGDEAGADPAVEVAFADTGAGIPADELSRIFEPFYTTKPPGEGTGLGLAVAKRIVDFHNGIIDVASTVGEGATFVIQFPVE
ncbi:PAS domain S-box protein [bacterium]|nr:PAS domain S-box protein [bacterium]